MHIKKLEICGFKSFVDRTVIHFDEDMIGIVGPNGCGKSNIVDAIRWSMGEQSAKHLRGKSMTDVIFAGSESRGPHGMAEVTLTFDNTDAEAAQSLPLEYRDWADIAVTRRLHRDGTSEYLINKTQVRLKDITDLFLGTGVGTKAYSIIEQGKIGLIVSARPEDRRMLIEEAAGITKYKSRRKQAQNKMDATRQNLLRVGDIVSEIERNLSSLKRQAAKAERYVSYKDELEDLVLHESTHRLLELTVVTQVEEASKVRLTEREQVCRTELDARDAELEVARQEAHQKEELAETSQNDAFQADNQVRTVEAELTRGRDELRRFDERRAGATREQHDLTENLQELQTELGAVEATLTGAEEDEARAEQLFEEATGQLEQLTESQSAADQTVVELRAQVAESSQSVAASEATLSGFARRIDEMGDRKQRLSNEEDKLSVEREDLVTRGDSLREHAAEIAEGKRISAEEHVRLETEMKALREATVIHDHVVDEKKNVLSQRRSRLRALEELHDRLEGVGAGVKALIASGDPALGGLLADRFEVPEDLTAAFAGLMGDQLQIAVVDDIDRGLALLDELAASRSGRATIVSARPAFVAGRSPRPVRRDGVVGPLIDHVAYAPEDEALARTFIGDALVVEDAHVALALRAEGECVGQVIVTRDGTVVHTDGRVSGGSGDAVAAGMIEQKREMHALHDVVAALADEVTELLDRQQAMRKRTTEVGTALDRARTEAHQGELALVTAEKDLKQAEERLAAVDKRLEAVRAELAELAQALELATSERQEAEETLEQSRTLRDETSGALEVAEEQAAGWREQVQRQQAVTTERKVEMAQVRERANSARGTQERLARSCIEMENRIERLDDERTECAVGAGQAAARIIVFREQLSEAVEAARQAQARFSEAKQALEEVRNALGIREADLKGMRQELEEVVTDLSKHEMALQKLSIELQHLLDGVRERFRGLELHRIVGDYHRRPPVDENHRTRIVELAHLIDRMGPVNVDAVREHAEASERFTYYTEQQLDLEQALENLDKAIAQMNRECRRLFRETYDGVNARFKVLFPKMFRGGHAELRLTNPDDLLETGIEILAQPPGKKLGNIELMSGGEKALTAVSLIFAIFQFKPSPFCILDEVDAPLDEANVTRYNEAIRSMTDRSQFILITHIKRTMQSVDVLYGVTMQEPGVSRLVSVRVHESVGRSTSQRPAASRDGAQQAAVA